MRNSERKNKNRASPFVIGLPLPAYPVLGKGLQLSLSCLTKEVMPDEMAEAVSTSILSHLLTVGGFLLAVFAIARLMRERRQPSNTLAWLFGIFLVPYVVVPLYLLFGGRKIARLAAAKSRVLPQVPGAKVAEEATRNHPTAHTICASGAPEPVGGNAVRLVTNGEEAFAELEKLILGAKESIHITTFILARDDTGRRLVALLAERARQGIKVRLLLDALGCFFSSRRFVDPIREAGGEVVRFMPMLPLTTRSSANLRNHRKIAVFDQHTALIGGHNLAKEYMGPHPFAKRWTDLGAIVTGPGAALLNEVFLADWSFASHQPHEKLHEELDPAAVRLEGRAELQVVASGPDVNGDPLYDGIVSMIQEARTSIWIITPYFIPDEVLMRTLVLKARAGRDVTLIIPFRSNHPVTDLVRRVYLRELIEAGARVLTYMPGMLHSKALIVDDQLGLVGSANFDMRSLFVNFEIGVFLYTSPEVESLRVWAGNLVRHCIPLPSHHLERRGFVRNLTEDLARFLAPLL